MVILGLAGRELPFLGVHRSVNGFIGVFFCVSWITNNMEGSKNSNFCFYLRLKSYESSFALDSLQKVRAVREDFSAFGRMAPEFNLFDQIRAATLFFLYWHLARQPASSQPCLKIGGATAIASIAFWQWALPALENWPCHCHCRHCLGGVAVPDGPGDRRSFQEFKLDRCCR